MLDSAARLAEAVAGRYRLGPSIGRGGMSVVYTADDLRHNRKVAIKLFTETVGSGGAERFVREIGFLARLHHPHILPLLDSGTTEGLLYYVMPLVEGESLRGRMSREPALSLQETLRILIEICDALRYAHHQGIVHRDIKPENVLLVDRHAVVADFGIARAVHKGDGSSNTTAGFAVGTPAYMSPEQAAADPQIDHRADIYALGVVAYELLAGRPPFESGGPQGVLAAHVTTKPPDLALLRPDLPPELAAVIMRCLAKPAADRWPDAGALSDALEPFLLPSGSVTPIPMAPFQQRRRTAWTAGVMTLVAVGAAVMFMTRDASVNVVLGEPQRLGVATTLQLDPVISPDGRMLAWVEGDIGAMRVRVRQLAGGAAITVAEGTGGNQRWPKWSPDGSRVAFQAGGTVYTAPALGGAARVEVEGTAEAPAGDFVWAPEGARTAYTRDGILWVQDANGPPTALVRDGTAHAVAWSPDGRFIAYVQGNREFVFSEILLANIAPSRLFVVGADGGDPIPITDGQSLATSPVWLGDGTLVWVGGGGSTRDLYAARLSRRGRPAGATARLTTGLRVHTVSAAPNGAGLVYTFLDQVANVWAVELPWSGEPVVSIRDAYAVTEGDQIVEDLDVFPVGGMLLFDSNRGGSQDIWMQTSPNVSPIPLTSDPADEFGPVWSPNAREVAYYAVRNGVRQLFVMRSTGQDKVQVTRDSMQSQQPQWSPDGTSLVFFQRDGAGFDRLFVTTRDDTTWSAPRLLTDEYGTGADWSSDGRFVAFTDREGNLRVITVEGGVSRIVATPADVGGLPIRRPMWLFGELAMLARAEGPGGTGGIWRFSLIGGAAEELVRFDDPERPVYRTDMATDGRSVYLLLSHFSSSVWRIALEGAVSD